MIALIGNPNSGKTTVFNALTGLRQKVGNYPGVTVEKKEGRITFEDGTQAPILDLPGTYSLAANSPDEKLATDILLGRAIHTPPPSLVVCVIDASNLERNLYLVSQILDRGLPVILALNMIDVAQSAGISIDARVLERALRIPVIPTIASKGKGIPELKRAISRTELPAPFFRQWRLPDPVERECAELVGLLQDHQHLNEPAAFTEAVNLLTTRTVGLDQLQGFTPELIEHVRRDHEKLEFLGIDRQSVEVESRYRWIKSISASAVTKTFQPGMSLSDRIDRVAAHKIWGFVLFFGLMGLMFQAVFSWAVYPMEWIGNGFDWIGAEVTHLMPPGDLRDLVVHGGLSGVAAVVTFLPQILFLFLFLGLLEDTGYMARAAFVMDRSMSKVGLHGKSFIPLLSSFGCAVPGIMATRTIDNAKDRLATILVAPLMSCSARLPIFALLIAAFIPDKSVLGIISLPALTLLSMYLLGLVAALTMAWVFKKTILKGPPPVFIMELPPYKLPSLKSVLLQMWERALSFLKRAGTIILGVSVILWFLASYPRLEHAKPSEQMQHSFAGMAGHAIEPLIRPLGFDWKVGIGLVSSLFQREVFVSTMGTLYNIQDAGESNGTATLRQQMQQDRDPVTGRPLFTTLTALCIMVYYVLAMQCMSTVVVVHRETNSWRWPVFQIGYMTALAYMATFVVYRAGIMMGIGG